MLFKVDKMHDDAKSNEVERKIRGFHFKTFKHEETYNECLRKYNHDI